MIAPRIDFSIIIPTRNRTKDLLNCLERIAQLEYPPDRFEVIVVDDGGSVALDELLTRFRQRLAVSLFLQPHLGPASARNLGASHACGKYLVFTDDDCWPDPAWLSRLQAVFSESPDIAVGGLTVNALEGNIYSEASQMLILFLCGYFNRDPDDSVFLTSSNLSFPTERFRQLGGFSTQFASAGGEDRELCDRWRHAGLRMRYRPDVLVKHSHALTFAQFWRQHRNYGQGAYHFHRMRHNRSGQRLQIEPLAFYSGMLKFPFGETPSSRAIAISPLFAVSQLANATGFFREKFRFEYRKRLKVPRTPSATSRDAGPAGVAPITRADLRDSSRASAP